MTRNSLYAINLVTVLCLAACATPGPRVDLFGQAAPPAAADRTIVITPATRHVNVEGGQIVRFIVDGREFGWNFNTASTVSSFDLNDVVPPGTLNQTVRAYVSPDPKYMGGGDHDN